MESAADSVSKRLLPPSLWWTQKCFHLAATGKLSPGESCTLCSAEQLQQPRHRARAQTVLGHTEGSTPEQGLQQQLRAPSNSSSFTWEGRILLTDKCLVCVCESMEAPESSAGQGGGRVCRHCHLLSMGCESMALHSTGSRSCQCEQG